MTCNAENLTTHDFYNIGNTKYFYLPCVSNRNESYQLIKHCFNCNSSTNSTLLCAQFCDKFEEILPLIYLYFSCLSAVCCLGVFATYLLLPRLRQSGYSSKVFLHRYITLYYLHSESRGGGGVGGGGGG